MRGPGRSEGMRGGLAARRSPAVGEDVGPRGVGRAGLQVVSRLQSKQNTESRGV